MSIGNLDARLFEKSTCWHNSIKRKKWKDYIKIKKTMDSLTIIRFTCRGDKRNRASSADDFLFVERYYRDFRI